MIDLPSIQNYGRYSSSNYGAHTLCVTVGDLTVYFSYSTPVAFRSCQHGLVICENQWGPTTGKHLNWIDGGGSKRHRVDAETFARQFHQAMHPSPPWTPPASHPLVALDAALQQEGGVA
jgi:hypothetical protein